MKKSRAQQDAELLAALEGAQNRFDSGDASMSQIESELNLSEDLGESNLDEVGDVRRGQDPVNPQPIKPEDSRVEPGDIEEMRKEIKAMKRTISQYEQELHPAQRRAMELEREVEELRRKASAAPPQPDGPIDYGLTEDEKEFDTVTSIAEKVNRATMSKLEKKLLDQLEEFKTKLGIMEQSKVANDVEAAISRHRSEMTRELGGDNPDDIFVNPKLAQWSESLSNEEVLALRNPLEYSPKFVAGLLNRFKSEVKGQAERKPSHGESSVPSRVAPDLIERKGGASGSDPVFNPKTFQSDVNKLISNGKTAEAERLIQVAERSMTSA